MDNNKQFMVAWLEEEMFNIAEQDVCKGRSDLGLRGWLRFTDQLSESLKAIDIEYRSNGSQQHLEDVCHREPVE